MMNPWTQPLPALQWPHDGFLAELQPHPLSLNKGLLTIVVDEEWADEPDLEPALQAQALHALLRLNGDALLPTGWAAVLDEDDTVLLQSEVDLQACAGPEDLTPQVAQGLSLAPAVRDLWQGLLTRPAAAPNPLQSF